MVKHLRDAVEGFAGAECGLSPEAFKGVFSRLASGVVVITFQVERDLQGFTATSLTPVSMTPPIALFCVGRMNGSHRHLTIGKRVGISMLAAGQSALARRFAQRSAPGSYADIGVSESDAGVPVISGAIAAVEATVREIVAAGDHTVFLCDLDRAVLGSDADPLLYVRRSYHVLGEAKG